MDAYCSARVAAEGKASCAAPGEPSLPLSQLRQLLSCPAKLTENANLARSTPFRAVHPVQMLHAHMRGARVWSMHKCRAEAAITRKRGFLAYGFAKFHAGRQSNSCHLRKELRLQLRQRVAPQLLTFALSCYKSYLSSISWFRAALCLRAVLDSSKLPVLVQCSSVQMHNSTFNNSRCQEQSAHPLLTAYHRPVPD